MADLAYTDTAEPRRPSLRVAVWRERYQVLAFVGIAALVVGFAAAGGGYFPTAWGWTALALMWAAALALMLAPTIELTRLELGALAGWTAFAAIGESQLARGRLAAARASFRKAIGKDERDWSLWLDLARASEGRAQLAALGRASELNPLSPEVAQFRTELAELGTIQVGG